MPFDIAGRSHVGILRAGRENEDAFAVAEHPAAAVVALAVADGVGGAPAGDRASRAAVGAFSATSILLDPPSTLREAVRAAAAAVRAIPEGAPHLSGSSTTIVFAYASMVDDRARAWVANLGDSRAYHLHHGVLARVSVDHSWVQKQIDIGYLSEEEARIHPRRNLITHALNTHGGDDEADYFELDLAPGDRLLLCTDGLHGPLDDTAIARLLVLDASADELASALVEAALDAGGPDNVTVAVLCVTPEDAGVARRGRPTNV